MKLHHIRQFVAIAEQGSLHRAARTMGVAQSALSRGLQELEKSLGAVLVERSQRGAMLTPAGHRFLLRGRLILSELQRSVEDTAQTSGDARGRVTIGLSPTAQLLVLPRVIPAFRKAWPRVHLSILDRMAEQVQPMLLAGALDFYVGIAALGPVAAGIAETPLADIERVAIVRPGSRWRKVTQLADLADAPWIDIAAGDGLGQELATGFALDGLTPPDPAFTTTSMLAVALLLQSVDAVALVPRAWSDSSFAAPAFLRLPLAEPLGHLSLSAMTRAALPLTPAAQWLFDRITEAARTPA